MKLHENKASFKDAIFATSIYKGLREIYVEKDYWVTLALHTIFTSKNNNAWLSNHPIKSIVFSDTINTWHQIRKTYNSDFKALVFGELPNEKDIINTLIGVSNRLKLIKWTIVYP